MFVSEDKVIHESTTDVYIYIYIHENIPHGCEKMQHHFVQKMKFLKGTVSSVLPGEPSGADGRPQGWGSYMWGSDNSARMDRLTSWGQLPTTVLVPWWYVHPLNDHVTFQPAWYFVCCNVLLLWHFYSVTFTIATFCPSDVLRTTATFHLCSSYCFTTATLHLSNFYYCELSSL